MSEKRPFICYAAPSFAVANDFRFAHKQCPGLVEHGFRVCYFAQSGSDREEIMNGVEIIPLKKEKSKLKQALLPWKILPRLLKKKCDAYHLSNAEMMPIAILLKIITRRRIVFDFREDYVEFVKFKPYLKGPLGWLGVAVTRAMVWLICKSMDGVIFGDEGVQESYPEIPKSRWIIMHHFPLLSIFKPNHIPYRDRKYHLVYLGTMSETGGIFVMLEAIEKLKEKYPRIKVLLIGEPVVYIAERFYKFVEEKKLNDIITITGKVPYRQVPELLSQAKVGLIGLKNFVKFHKQSATKLFEYMTQAIPCVSVDLPPERRFMESGKHGFLVPIENPEAMADAVYKIITDDSLGEKMSGNAYEHLLENGYYAEKESDVLAEFYRSILGRSRRKLCED
jgi:glycosyltransferase involved in cell wall biosynthesis